MSDQKPIYAPCFCKLIDTKNGNQFMKLSFSAEKMMDFIQKNKNAKGYVNLNISERREVGEYGDTHSVKLDTWEPSGEKKQSYPRQQTTKHSQEKANAYQREERNDEILF